MEGAHDGEHGYPYGEPDGSHSEGAAALATEVPAETVQVPETLASFRLAAAQAAARRFETRVISYDYELMDYILTLGLNSDNVTFEGRVATVTLTEDDGHAPLPRGIEDRSELTLAAQAALDVKALRKLRAAFWSYLRDRQRRGTLKGSAAEEMLAELGYTALPVTITKVSGEFRIPHGDGCDTEDFSFTLAGETSKEAVLAKLEAELGASPGEKLVRRVFGQKATDVSGSSLVSSLTVTSSRDWPEKSEYHD